MQRRSQTKEFEKSAPPSPKPPPGSPPGTPDKRSTASSASQINADEQDHQQEDSSQHSSQQEFSQPSTETNRRRKVPEESQRPLHTPSYEETRRLLAEGLQEERRQRKRDMDDMSTKMDQILEVLSKKVPPSEAAPDTNVPPESQLPPATHSKEQRKVEYVPIAGPHRGRRIPAQAGSMGARDPALGC
jgi:hypothetical protein